MIEKIDFHVDLRKLFKHNSIGLSPNFIIPIRFNLLSLYILGNYIKALYWEILTWLNFVSVLHSFGAIHNKKYDNSRLKIRLSN